MNKLTKRISQTKISVTSVGNGGEVEPIAADSSDYSSMKTPAAAPTIKVDIGGKVERLNGKSTLKKVNFRYKRSYFEVFGAELFGTAFLMLFGCMSCVSVGNVTTDSYISSAAFGFIIASIIGIFGHISAAHLNPAVSFAIYLMGGIKFTKLLVYIVAEFLGAILGMGALLALTPKEWLSPLICVTQPQPELNSAQALAIEFTCTCFLCLVMCGAADSRSPTGESSSIRFALVIIALGLACGKYTGASMNPARSLAPALWTGHWYRHWIYWLGPLSGAVVGPLMYKIMWSPRNCDCTDDNDANK